MCVCVCACVCMCVHVKRAPKDHSLYYFGRLEGTRETTVGKGGEMTVIKAV